MRQAMMRALSFSGVNALNFTVGLYSIGLIFIWGGTARNRGGLALQSPPVATRLADRPRCRVGQLLPKVEDWNWETFTDINIIALYTTTVMYLASKLSKTIKFSEKHEISVITPFKVIQAHRGRYQSKAVCDFLLVSNSN